MADDEAVPVGLHPVASAVTVAVATTAAGAVMVIPAVPVHPLLSVTVMVYEPAESPVALALVWPEGFHK